MLPWANPAFAVMVAVTGALAPGGTITFGTSNATAAGALKNAGVKVLGPVASAGADDRVYVTTVGPVLRKMSATVRGPASLSPSDSLEGAIRVAVTTASSIRTMPAP